MDCLIFLKMPSIVLDVVKFPVKNLKFDNFKVKNLFDN